MFTWCKLISSVSPVCLCKRGLASRQIKRNLIGLLGESISGQTETPTPTTTLTTTTTTSTTFVARATCYPEGPTSGLSTNTDWLIALSELEPIVSLAELLLASLGQFVQPVLTDRTGWTTWHEIQQQIRKRCRLLSLIWSTFASFNGVALNKWGWT